MRTTLDIEDALLKALLARHPEMTKTEAIELAIRNYLAADAAQGLRELAGGFEIEDLTPLRRHAHR